MRCHIQLIGRESGWLTSRPMVEYEQQGRVAVFRINRPEARNAVHGDVASGMEAAIDRLEEDPDPRVGVIPHEGPLSRACPALKAIASGQAPALATSKGG